MIPAIAVLWIEVDFFPQDYVEIPGLTQFFLQSRDVVVNGIESFRAIVVGVAVRHDRLPGGLTDGDVHMGVIEVHSRLGEAVG